MLNVYYGRSNIDFEKFVYDNLGQKAFIVVPDQYKLTAEKQALKYLERSSIINIEITGIMGLGRRLLDEQGMALPQIIDSYGRRMLVGRIIKDNQNKLRAFKGLTDKNAFIDLVCDFISEFKQNNGTEDVLVDLKRDIEEDGILNCKLEDLGIILTEYEKLLEGKYMDNEDYIDNYITSISNSELIKNSEIWIYGFNSLAPIMVKLIEQLSLSAKKINLVINYDEDLQAGRQFLLSNKLINTLKINLEEVNLHKIDDIYNIEKADDLNKLETSIFNEGLISYKEAEAKNIKMVAAANPYYEAESAAAYVLDLLRNENYRLRDIAIICNDENKRGSIIRRTFEEYGIDIFNDNTKQISSSPIIRYIISQLQFINKGFVTDDIFTMLKTGLYGIDNEDIETFENYVKKYNIKGSMWKKEIKYGSFEYSEDELAKLELIRRKVIIPMVELENLVLKSTSYSDFVLKYYKYLVDEREFSKEVFNLSKIQEREKYFEEALETKQIFNTAFDLMNQLSQVLGDEEFKLDRFIDIYLVGLKNVKIGVIPPTVDEILLGSNQRTRIGSVKALLIIGLNEGVLPLSPQLEGLFSVAEKEKIIGKGYNLGKSDENFVLEEFAAVYRNITKPTEKLFLSYALSDEEGNELKPSQIIEEVRYLLPKLKPENDIVNSKESTLLVNGRLGTLRHLIEYIRETPEGELDKTWVDVYNWFMRNEESRLDSVIKGLSEDNSKENLSRELTEILFSKGDEFVFSPSRLEKYTKCPFEHFVMYGLRPKELRSFSSTGREIGDVYHECLMKISKNLTQENVSITSDESKWMKVTKEECELMVEDVLSNLSDEYRDGLMKSNTREEYRLTRINEICKSASWNMICQMRSSNVKEAFFEEKFAKNGVFKPIVINTGSDKVNIEGKIDRVDILNGNSVRIIDYKTGNESFNANEVGKGYRLQLMLYLAAAQEEKRDAAGVFYFLIKDKILKADGIKQDELDDKIDSGKEAAYRLDGLFVDEESIINDLANDKQGMVPSSIIKARYNKKEAKWKPSSKKAAMDEDTFKKLQEEAVLAATSISKGIIEGEISLRPVKLRRKGNLTECEYCGFKGICKFDLDFEDNKYYYI
ncbi:MAG: PD-(D/E)XK nuclease family protein [Peptostreptococcaceae bacterium]|nr:PD-(D/E)XK nuclease family protein [Peptostreptococcaceae bacterium]